MEGHRICCWFPVCWFRLERLEPWRHGAFFDVCQYLVACSKTLAYLKQEWLLLKAADRIRRHRGG